MNEPPGLSRRTTRRGPGFTLLHQNLWGRPLAPNGFWREPRGGPGPDLHQTVGFSGCFYLPFVYCIFLILDFHQMVLVEGRASDDCECAVSYCRDRAAGLRCYLETVGD